MMNALSRDSRGGNAIVEELLMPGKPIRAPGSLSTGSIVSQFLFFSLAYMAHHPLAAPAHHLFLTMKQAHR
jgi:hypothetical protein